MSDAVGSSDDRLTNSPVFCILPWLHICGSIDGIWGRCCVDSSMYQDAVYDSDAPNLALPADAVGCTKNSVFAPANPQRTFDLEEAFNSPAMRNTRLSMLSGEPVSACRYCYVREAGGGESYRQKANADYAAEIHTRTRLTAENGSVASFPSYLDIRFGNTCNLACIMCGYPISSRWGLEHHPAWAPAHIDPYSDDEQLWTLLRTHSKDLRKVYFAGGEPFLQKGHFRLLDLLIETGAAGHVGISYTSNLTTVPDGIFARLSQFASAEIGASCDGTGELFERIRVGAKWSTFVRNLREAKQHLPVWLSVTPQRDNIMHLGEIIEFGRTEEVRVDLTNLLRWPAELSVQAMSQQDKLLAHQYLKSLREHYERASMDDLAAQLSAAMTFMQHRDLST